MGCRATSPQISSFFDPSAHKPLRTGERLSQNASGLPPASGQANKSETTASASTAYFASAPFFDAAATAREARSLALGDE